MNGKNKDYILYLDMDGVLVDFEHGFFKLSSGIDFKRYSEMYSLDGAKKRYMKEGIAFWENLEWIHGGKEIWETSVKLFENINILSSTGKQDQKMSDVVREGKLLWLKKHIPSISENNVFIVNGRIFKQKYATKVGILVDDAPDTIQQWNAAGGFGILHRSGKYKHTIEELEDIALPMNLSGIVKRFK